LPAGCHRITMPGLEIRAASPACGGRSGSLVALPIDGSARRRWFWLPVPESVALSRLRRQTRGGNRCLVSDTAKVSCVRNWMAGALRFSQVLAGNTNDCNGQPELGGLSRFCRGVEARGEVGGSRGRTNRNVRSEAHTTMKRASSVAAKRHCACLRPCHRSRADSAGWEVTGTVTNDSGPVACVG
jgi:hypothetical protein